MRGLRRIFFSVFFCCTFTSVQATEILSPEQVVRQTTDQVLNEIRLRKAELEANPTRIYPLIKQIMVSRFDTVRFTRLAMGRFWRKATEQQKTDLIHEFQQVLIRTYALALLNYTGQEIEYLATQQKEGGKGALVQTRLHDGNRSVPIHYRMTQSKTKQWLVYDVVIDGISLITNYRSIFNNAIREGALKAKNPQERMKKGIDHLIDRLANKNTAQ